MNTKEEILTCRKNMPGKAFESCSQCVVFDLPSPQCRAFCP